MMCPVQKWHHEFQKDSYIGFEQFCWTQVYYNLEVEWLSSWMFSRGSGEAKEIHGLVEVTDCIEL